MKRLLIGIGRRHYVVEPRDAIVLLDIASRAVEVEQTNYKEPWRQTAEQEPFVTEAVLVNYDPMALPVLPPEPPEMPF